MEQRWRITFEGGRPLAAERVESGGIVETVSGLTTLSQVVARTGKSRRQLYRDMRAGRLQPIGKFGGEWLFAERGLPVPRRLRLPRTTAPLFPDREADTIDTERDWKMVATRIMEAGSIEEMRWAIRRYGRRRMAGFVKAEGRRRLSPRAAAFWSLYLGVRAGGARPSWRDRGQRAWGVP